MWCYIFVVIIFEAFAPVFSFTDIIISVDNEKRGDNKCVGDRKG